MSSEGGLLHTPSENHNNEKLRLWSALSFAVMLIPIGIPLWWKTTEVYRAPLPFDRINRLDTTKLSIAYTIYVYTEYPTRTNSIIRELTDHLSSSKLYKLDIRPHKIDIENLTLESVEAATWIHPKQGCQLLLVELPQLRDNLQVLVSRHRIVYFTLDTKVDVLSRVMSEWLLHSNDLEDDILSIVDPDELKRQIKLERTLLETINKEVSSSSSQLTQGSWRRGNPAKLRRLRASPTPGYDVIFTVINSDPENVRLVWDIQSAIQLYFQPLLDQMQELREHVGKSQWLYLVDLSQQMRDARPHNVIPYSQLAHIITPLEKKLGSGVLKNACVHMIAYVSACSVSPVSMLSAEGETVSGMVSPEWGAIQIINPEPRHCTKNNTSSSIREPLVPVSHKVMAVFVTQFHTLLGVSIRDKIEGCDSMIDESGGPLLSDWQLDALYTLRTVQQITLATLTLQSLSKLLGEISNIVINEEVAMSVTKAVDSVEAAVEALKNGLLSESLHNSTTAYLKAEMGFTNPSLLALLYFPDDQKYAVYIPLFLPIMIPVLMSLKKIYNWLIVESSCTFNKKADGLKEEEEEHIKSQ